MAEEERELETRSWFWAWNSLRTPRPGQASSCSRARLAVAETCLFLENECVAWIFTSAQGEVKRKHSKRLRIETIAESMLIKSGRDADEAGARPAQRHAVAVRRGNDSATEVKAELLTAEELQSKTGEGGGLTGGLLALQCAVHPRGGGGTRYRCEANAAGNGLVLRYSVHKLCYLGAPTESEAPHPRSVAGAALGVGPAFSIKCTMHDFNKDLQRRTAAIVSHLSDVGRTRIVRLQADFILSAANDEPILVSMPLVQTCALPTPPKHSTSSLTNVPSAASLARAPTDPATINMLMRAASLPQLPPADQPVDSRHERYASPLGGRDGRRGRPSSASKPEEPTPAEATDGAERKKSPERAGWSGQCGGGWAAPRAQSANAGPVTKVVVGGAGGAGSSPGRGTLARPQSATALLSSARHRQPGSRAVPWMRLHPPLPRAFVAGAHGSRSRKVLVCSGDFCNINPVGEVEEEEREHKRFSRRGSQEASPSAESPPKSPGKSEAEMAAEEEAFPKGAPLFMVPHRSVLQARAEHAVARDAAFSGDPHAGLLRAAMLQVAKPGRSHPAGPQLPHPADFYSSIMVCHSCYLVYLRLDAARARTTQPYDLPHSRGSRPNSAFSASAFSASVDNSASASACPSRVGSASSLSRVASAQSMPTCVKCAGNADMPPRSARSLRRVMSDAEMGANAPADKPIGDSVLRATELEYREQMRREQEWREQHARRPVRAPLRLAQLNTEDELGTRQVKRLLAELDRRPKTPLPRAPMAALRTSASSAVSLALESMAAAGTNEPGPAANTVVHAASNMAVAASKTPLGDSAELSLYKIADVAPGGLGAAYGTATDRKPRQTGGNASRERKQRAAVKEQLAASPSAGGGGTK